MTYDSYQEGFCAAQPGDTAIGRMTKMIDGEGRQLSCFDIRGSDLATRRSIAGADYDIDRTYTTAGDIATLQYPNDGTSRETVTYNYNTQGFLFKMQSSYGETLFDNVIRKPWGALQSYTIGSTSVSTAYEYDYRLRLTKIQLDPISSEILVRHVA